MGSSGSKAVKQVPKAKASWAGARTGDGPFISRASETKNQGTHVGLISPSAQFYLNVYLSQPSERMPMILTS